MLKKIGWEEVFAAVSEHGNVQFSQGQCQNIAAALNEAQPLQLSDIEYANEVSERAVENTIAGIRRDRSKV